MSKEQILSNQRRRFFALLHRETVTCSMAAETLGIPQKNLCRYKRYYEKLGVLWEVKKAFCRKTGQPACYLTTNSETLKNIQTGRVACCG